MKITARCVIIVIGLCFGLALISADHSRPADAAPSPQTTPIPPDIARKIEPALLKQLSKSKNSLTPFVAHFQVQADLRPAAGADRVRQRAAIANALQDTANRTQGGARALLATRQQQRKADHVRAFWIVNALAGDADRETIIELAARPEIEIVRLDHTRKLINDALIIADDDGRPQLDEGRMTKDESSSFVLRPSSGGENFPFNTDTLLTAAVEWNISQIHADQVWNALNIDGSGVVVATLDTGVDWQHPALMTKYRGYRGSGPAVHSGNWHDSTGAGYLYPGDGNSHGTHTMGTIVGGTADRAIGVAPGAQWIAVKIFTNGGYASDSWIHDAFQWVIAPEGDPALAPDIISNSWGDDNGLDTTFLADIRAVRAAGILPVFANGNNGINGAGTVGSPASFAEAFAVGATDNSDTVAYFSSRGPSPITGNIKPDISAPGVNVTSSVPGGGYGAKNGTSMATPHIAGVAALLKQAQPSLTISETIYAITSTATPLSTTLPNNETGWGRVDAYAAVLRLTSSGQLSGAITSNGLPVAGAQVVATDRISRTTQTTSNANGNYALPLSEGRYSVSVSKFGYIPSVNNSLWISSSQTTRFDVDLRVAPSASVHGYVTALGSGAPLDAKVSALNTPASATTDATGFYTLTLPIGTYTLRAVSWLHRVVTATITLNGGDSLTQDFALLHAPSILLVDDGAWYNNSQITYYTNALDSLGYLYTLRAITNTLSAVPNITTMLTYSITIWSSPDDSPGFVGAGAAIQTYLDAGGRLFVSGQDVAFWDAGGNIFFLPNYFPSRLYGQFAGESASVTTARGVAGEALNGITFTINTTDSARNQVSPDAVVPLTDNAHPLAVYDSDTVAGLAVSTCLPYRAAYLGFGLEGAGPAGARQQTLQNLIEWLMSPPPVHAFTLSTDSNIAVGLPNQVTTHTLTLRNTGQLADSYNLSLGGNAWSSTLWNSSFTQTLPTPINLAPCASQGIGARTSIPTSAGRNVSDTLSLNAQSRADGSLSQTRTLVSKTPATVLLVDDDRWYEEESSYQTALRARRIPYDNFDTRYGAGPSSATLSMYPVVVWFSGYDWYDPLSGADENSLAAYLNAGGRLFYSAQDYLYVRGSASTFARDYFGVLTYTNDMTITTVSGVPGHTISDGLGTYTLTYPYRNFSDFVTPTVSAATTFIGNNVAGSALNMSSSASNFKTVFFAFPFEALPSDQQPAIINNIVGWLGPLGDSTLAAPTITPPNSTFAYRLRLTSSNLGFAPSARVTLTLPADVTLISLDSPYMTYDSASRSVYWNGALPVASPPQATVRVNSSARFNDTFTATTLIDDSEGIVLARTAKTRIASNVMYFPFFAR